MNNILNYKKNLSKAFTKSADYVKKIGFESVAESIEETKKAFDEKEIMIVTVGEMKRGKSFAQNMILGETIFPVDMNVCTNVVTVVRYGKKEKVEVVLEENVDGEYKLTSKKIKREEIPEYVSEQFNAANHKNVKLLNVEIPNELLKENVVFVDTPGVGSLNVSHAETTYGFLPNADLLLFVSDSTAPLTDSELNFLEKGYKYCKNVIFPLTKKDLNPDYMEIANDNKAKISKTLGISEDEISIIPVSSEAKRRYLETNKEAMLKSSNFEELEKTIWSMIAETRMEIMVIPFVEAVNRELYSVAESIATQHQVLVDNKENFPQLQELLNNEIKRYDEFLKDSSDWQDELTNSFEKMQNSNSAIIKNAFDEARKIVKNAKDKYGVKLCNTDCYNMVYAEINELISRTMLDIKGEMLEQAGDVIDDINEKLGLDVSSYKDALSKLGFTPDKTEISVKFHKRKVLDKIGDGGRKITSGMMSFGKVGAIIGGTVAVGVAVVAGPAALAAAGAAATAEVVITGLAASALSGATVGGALGGAVGTVKGTVEAVTTVRDRDIPYVCDALMSHINTVGTRINQIISDGYSDLKKVAKQEIRDQIKKKRSELEESIKRMRKMLESQKPDDAKIRELEIESDNITKQIDAYLEFDTVYGVNPESNDEQSTEKGECTEYSFM